jgi:trimeric autotransporter adhesin
MTLIRTWLDFALQQMAAESYIHRAQSGELGLLAALKMGNNNLPGDQSDTDILPGKTRMTTTQAQAFAQRYQIIDHHANDATGFSATLMFDTQTNSYTLSFRSTESATTAQGGDRERDLLGADAEIGFSGFAFGQLAAMEEYYSSLKASGKLSSGAVLNVTGFSLGGHLATVFTELHVSEVNHTYIFNGAGRGHVSGAVPGLTAEENRISDMLAYFRSVLDNPNNALASFPRTSIYDQAKALYDAQGSSWHPFDQGTASLYSDVRYQWAKAATQMLFGPSGLTFLQSPGEVQDQGPFEKITQLYGQATTDDLQFIANSGIHAPAIPVFIEGQPLIAGVPSLSFTESGNTHSITLIVDSLAVQELIQTIDPRYGQASAELLIKAFSNAKADTVASLNVANVSEGDSLEKTVDAFRKLFVGPNAASQPLPVDSTIGGFGNLAFRNEMYTAMAAITQAVEAKQAQGVVFTIDDLTDPTVSAPVIAGIADTDTDQGLAYRYALKELNPFAIMANTLQANDALYQAHNDQGQLIRVNLTDGTGAFTVQYLTDRALFLKEKIALNQLDLEKSSGNVHFKDVTPHGLEITTVIDLREDREFLFGSDNPDTLTGGSQANHLYGGGSVDVLIGNAGRDYLEGNGGSDRLEGGAGADMMVGGSGNDTYLVDDLGDQVIEVGDNGSDIVQSSVTFTLGANIEDLTLTGSNDLNGTGNDLDNQITGNSGMNRLEGKDGTDHLIGNDGNDVLIGGDGDLDLLEGGIGFDTYIYNASDGLDRIEDSDAQGQIIFNGHRLLGGIHNPDDPLNTYKSLDGLTTYVLSGTDLIVNGVLIVNENFESGQFGIDLRDVLEPNWENDYPVVIDAESDGFINNILNYSDVNDLGFGERGNDQLFGNGGNDILRGWSGNDRLYGGTGDDVLDGDWRLILFDPSNPPFALGTDSYYGDDWVEGGEGNDTIYGSWGDDVLYGGTGNDLLYGDHALPDRFTFTADDFLDGGEGDDELHGMAGDDVLVGGDGNDTLLGGEGDDWMDGGAGVDVLWAGVGHDSLSGGSGNDVLLGDLGHDLLDGGTGVDVLYGGDGEDELFGGAGNDLLFGDGLNTPEVVGLGGGNDFLDGGDGDDELQGMIGDDYLFGGAGDDLLLGQEDDDTLFGDDGNDQLVGGVGDDLLYGDAGDDVLDGHLGDDHLFGGTGNDGMAGGEGNDALYGDAGNDTLQGDQGNDVLVGGAGNDIYNFSLGDGQDTITDTVAGAEGNFINFFDRITLESLTFVHDPLQQTLTIQVGGGADSIRLLGFDPNRFQYVVVTLRFSDGSFVALADQLPLPGGLVEGTDEANLIRTGSSDDTIFAGAGDDVVYAGAGNDLLTGGTGADTLQGGAGQDRYLFNTGDGTDTIVDSAGEGNRLVFGTGISAGSVTLQLVEGDAIAIRTGQLGDRIQIISSLEGADQPAVDVVEFADGSTVSIEQLLAQGIVSIGTMDGDVLTGTPLVDQLSGLGGDDVIFGGFDGDRIFGNEGNDQLLGGDGDDLLDGGSGSDVLNGEDGADTYVFGRESGQDLLSDLPVEQGGPNTIQLTSEVSPGDVHLQVRQAVDGMNLVLTIEGSSAELTLVGASDPSLLQISEIRFANGTRWDMDQILSRIEGVRVTASAFGSELEGSGFRDELNGAAGNDVLDGLGNADRMVGGDGDDWYWVDHAGDTVVETAGQGTDLVFSFINYTLPDHVEDLLLWGTDQPSTDPVRAEGNAGANRLIGNFVNNVLVGGAGSDTLYGGFSVGGDYGAGDDDLFGGSGNDTYVAEGDFNGFDLIHDVALHGEGNRLQFGTSMRPEDVVFVRDGSSLRITNSGAVHGVILAEFDPTGAAGSLVTDVVAFSSGVEDITGGYDIPLLALMNPMVGTDREETFVGTANAEVIKAGAGDDTIVGKAGNDVLIGGIGNDTYVLNLGDGFDLIDDQLGLGGINRVQFGGGITQEMLRVSYSGTSGVGGLSIRIGTSGDGVHLLGVSADDPEAAHAVDSFHFVDGSQLSFAQLFDREIVVQGTGRGDGELFGTAANDRMFGLSGGEWLSSGEGDDFIIGGTGNDVLEGGGGSDTYLFNLGDGIDVIYDEISNQYSADVNRLRFGVGITASDVVLSSAPGSLRDEVSLVTIGTAGDQIVLPNFVDSLPALTLADFADGVTLDLYALHVAHHVTANQTSIGGTGDTVLLGGMGDDTVLAGSDTTTILGLVGHDTLVGGAGADLLFGGRGNDLIQGGAGDDTYLFNLGDGIDTIEDVAAVGEGNRIQFGTGITRNDLTFSQDDVARTLTIEVGASGTDQLVLTNFDPTGVNGSLVIENVAFADGSTASLVSLLGGSVNQAPTVVTPLADQTVLEDASLSIQTPTSTFVDQDAHDVLAYSASLADGTALPTWLTFDSVTHTFGGIPTNSEVGTLHLAVTATDSGGLSATSSFTLTVQNVNDAPTIAMPLADQSVTQGSLFTFIVSADSFTDDDAGDTLAYSATRADGTTLPTWLTFNPSTRTFSGTPQGPDIGTLDVRVTATDSGTLSASDVFALTILPILGTEGNDTLVGADGDDIIRGLAGDDVLQGLAGNDLLDGGAGIDSMAGGLGNDIYVVDVAGDVVTEVLNQGTDTVQSSITYTMGANVENLVLTGTGVFNGTGNSLNNSLTGNNANNLLNGGAGADTMIGGQGNDIYVVDNVGDVVTELENQGIDTVQTGRTHTLGANLENLTLTGSAVIDGTGNSLDNTLRGNSAANVLTGGAGNDMYVVGTGDTVVEQLNEGVDTVQTAVTWTLGAHLEQLTLTGAGTINGTGNSLNNVLIGNSAANTLDADGGDDILNGGAGADILIGGTDNDTYVVDNVGDVVTENFNEGTDLVQSSVSYTLSANVEHLTLTGAGAINATGNTLNNRLTGNSGANMIDGGVGADTLIGGAGNDTYVVDDVGDVVTEAAAQGTDTVQSAITYVLGMDVENLTLTGSTAITGTGNSLNNMLTGNSTVNTLTGLDGNDTLDGGAGADSLAGGVGNDTYVVDAEDDVVMESFNEGTDLVQSSVSYALAANVENLTLTGTTAINGVGNALNNRLTGNSAANVLTGGEGNDTYLVSEGDTVIELANGGTDTVQSDANWMLGANLENLTLTGATAIDATGNALNNRLTGNDAGNQLVGGAGNDTMRGGLGNDTYLIDRGEGRDVLVENDGTSGNSDLLQYGGTINPLDLVISRQVNDLRLAVHGSADQVTIRDWYLSTNHHIETVQAGDGTLLLSTQVDQLIQAMASFSQQSGLTWDQAIDQRPQDVQAILAANWQ